MANRRNLDDVNSFLLGGESIPSASFLTKGTKHEGEILELAKRQQTDPKTRAPLFWPNGDPKMQAVITIQTDETDPDIEDDDGRRRLFVKFKMRDAIAEAIREAGCEDVGLQVGGWISVTFTKQDKPASRTLSGVKHFSAVYEPPDEDAATNAYLMDGDEGEDDEPDEAPPPSRTRGRRANRAAAEPEYEPDEPAPSRGRRGSRQPVGASAGRSGRSASRGRGRSQYVNDDDEPAPI